MKCIDFDKAFSMFAVKWLKEHAKGSSTAVSRAYRSTAGLRMKRKKILRRKTNLSRTTGPERSGAGTERILLRVY